MVIAEIIRQTDNNHMVCFSNIQLNQTKLFYEIIAEYYDFDDSINQNYIINHDDMADNEYIITFYFYGMERQRIYIYAHYDNIYNDNLIIHFNMDYNEMDSIINTIMSKIN